MLLEFLGSMNLAITLLMIVAIAAVIGTVLQQNQSFQDYEIKFGPFWFRVFDTLGLYDVYTAGWFLALLTFMVISIAVCIYRNVPHMLKDMRQYREHAKVRTLRSFHHKKEWQATSVAVAVDNAVRLLKARGYSFKRVESGEQIMIAAMKGAVGRLGYLFTHGAIVLICIGGLIDGNVILKFREWSGDLKPETRNISASQIPEISTLSLDNPSFRASITIPEKMTARVAFLGLRDGYLVQPLPFSIEVKDFRIEHYATGQPKSFESDLVVTDLENPDDRVEQTIKVNHPLVFKGYTIYQSSFDDGGSKLDLKAWPLSAVNAPVEFQAEVDNPMLLPVPGKDLTLELVDFNPINVRPVEDPEDDKKVRNFGPRYNYKLRDSAGQAVEFTNYMLPVNQEGRMVFLSGMRNSPSEPFRYLHIPMDPNGSVERFMRFRGMMNDTDRVTVVAENTAAQILGEAGQTVPDAASKMKGAMQRVLHLFAVGGFDALIEQLEASAPEEKREEISSIYQRALEEMLSRLYIETLKDEGVDLDSGLSDADARFFDDAVIALGAMHLYGAPYYLQLTGFEHIQATGLQIAKTPGKLLVYLGCVLLILGVFAMFYLPHKRLWFRVAESEGGVDVLFAGMTPRNAYDFGQEFDAMAGYLEQQTEKG